MKPKTSILLGSMMFLQYYIWGSWYVTMGIFMTRHLNSTGIQIGAVYSALAIATMISPF
ncbi:MAG TPA: MFS transporter, partial [Ignavibacteria bacterium]